MNNNNRYSRLPPSSGSPFDRFVPQSPEIGRSYGRFDRSFQPSQPMIDRPDYTNRDELIHNNMHPSVLATGVTEYRIYIDSGDRDPTASTNFDPFNFRVTFNPLADGYVKSAGTKVMMKGSPTPHILKDFRNIKYIRIDNMILPVYSQFERTTLTEALISDWVDYYGSAGESELRILDADGDVITGASAPNSIDDIIGADGGYTPGGPIDDAIRLDWLNTRAVQQTQIDHRALDAEPLDGRVRIGRLYDNATGYDYYFEPSDDLWYIYKKNTGDASKLYDDRYVVLVIDEMKGDQVYGTNDRLSNAFGLIYPDRQFSENFYQGSTFQSSVIYVKQDLKNLTHLTFKFYLAGGSQLAFSHITNDAYSTSDPRHPLHAHLQNQMSLVIGVDEAHLNKETQYAR